MVTLDQALDAVNQLSAEQQEMLADILRRRQIEERRKEIARSAREAIRAFDAGELQPQSADQVIGELRDALIAPGDE